VQSLAILAENNFLAENALRKLEIEYLGLRIAYDKIMMDLIKIQGVAVLACFPVIHGC